MFAKLRKLTVDRPGKKPSELFPQATDVLIQPIRGHAELAEYSPGIASNCSVGYDHPVMAKAKLLNYPSKTLTVLLSREHRKEGLEWISD